MAAPNRRRSSLFPRTSNQLNETPVLDEPDVDEEVERRGRQKLQKRQSIGHGTPNNAQAQEQRYPNQLLGLPEGLLPQHFQGVLD